MHQPAGKRSSIVSALSGVLTLVLLAGLGISMWLTGGKMFSPGEISSKSRTGSIINNYRSHADFENDCAQCHQPLRSESQSVLCTGCHKNVTEQIAKAEGTHGRMKDVEKCASCHSEHKGRDFDSVEAALKNFSHNRTAFPLTDKHALTQCDACHLKNVSYGDVSKTCAGCHKEPAMHAGLFTPECASCHTTAAWQPAKVDGQAFDHQKMTFSLTKHKIGYDGQPINCTDCHGLPLKTMKTQTCIDCHTGHPAKQATTEKVTNPADFMSAHSAAYGLDCLKCHDGADRMNGFKHENVFVLDGKHAGLACEQCHAERVFQTDVRACSACHEEPKIHAGFFGLKCQLCHTTSAWRPAMLTNHNFPLNHGNTGEVACKVCHTGAYSQYTCYGCHDHQVDQTIDEHKEVKMPAGVSLEQCTTCHINGKKAKEGSD